MKKILILVLMLVSAHLWISAPASADPRMETNDNFCHFILDPNNTDKEVFVAGCDSVITVVEKVAITGKIQAKCEENNKLASGYAIVTKEMLPAALPVAQGNTLTLTSDNSTTPCTMVESNGRAYTSNKWRSTIKANREKRNGFVTVQYEVFCQDGQ
jgi:hypothetical protein